MRIAQLSPAWESVPPRGYGGVERVVSYLTEELVRQGHDVTLFASADSATSARLVPICDSGVRETGDQVDAGPIHIAAVQQAYERSEEFDILHFHLDYTHFLLAHDPRVPTVSTMHNRLDLPELQPLFRQFRDVPMVSISFSQRRPAPQLNWVGNVYHGLPLDLYHLSDTRDGYLAFLGRIAPEKGVESAIEIAGRAGMPLKIASKLDRIHQEYADGVGLHAPHVELVGEVGDGAKQEFLGNATALLFPIDWPEPFGLVMIEAMACGTPVIAFRQGAVPEVIDDGVTGFVCDTVDEAVECVGRVGELSRERCRQRFEERFDLRRVVDEYVSVYARLCERSQDEVA